MRNVNRIISYHLTRNPTFLGSFQKDSCHRKGLSAAFFCRTKGRAIIQGRFGCTFPRLGRSRRLSGYWKQFINIKWAFANLNDIISGPLWPEELSHCFGELRTLHNYLLHHCNSRVARRTKIFLSLPIHFLRLIYCQIIIMGMVSYYHNCTLYPLCVGYLSHCTKHMLSFWGFGTNERHESYVHSVVGLWAVIANILRPNQPFQV